MKTIILCGGKTLGHVTPGISVINELHKKYPTLRIIYITCDNQLGLKLINDSSIDKVLYFNLNFKNKFNKIVNVVKHYKKLNKIIKLYKPICIVSFGSILGTLSVLVGKKNKIKTVIHEQNAVMGLGNKLVLRQCDLVLTNYFLSKKYKQVGNPILIENQKINIIKDKKKLVITSGSNGSLVFSKLGIKLYNSKISNNFDITFITGKRYYEEVLKEIKERSNFKIVPFIDNLSSYLIDTSFIITRAGALTLSEIYYLDIYPIIIPSPNVTNNHQYKNAIKYKGVCTIIKENEIDMNKISNALQKCENEKILNLKFNSTHKFIEEIENVVKLY